MVKKIMKRSTSKTRSHAWFIATAMLVGGIWFSLNRVMPQTAHIAEVTEEEEATESAEIASPSPSPLPATPLTSLRFTGNSCTTLSFSWDKITGVSGYVIDISPSSDFNKIRSSGVLQSTIDSYTFEGLDVNTTYYARVTASSIHDYPRYTKLAGVKTKESCVTTTPAPSPTPKPSPRSTPKPVPQVSPSPSPKAESPVPMPSLLSVDPTVKDNNRFQGIGVDTGIGEAPKQSSLFARFVAWIASLFN